MNEIMRRMSLVERRVVEQDNDFADSRIMRSRAEGVISGLQVRQVQLDANVSTTRSVSLSARHEIRRSQDFSVFSVLFIETSLYVKLPVKDRCKKSTVTFLTKLPELFVEYPRMEIGPTLSNSGLYREAACKVIDQLSFPHAFVMDAASTGEHAMVHGYGMEQQVCEVRDTLATLDRRCASADSALHGAVSHGQVIDSIRSIMGPFREQVETRLSSLEKDASELNDARGQASVRELSAVGKTNRVGIQQPIDETCSILSPMPAASPRYIRVFRTQWGHANSSVVL